MTYFRRMGWSIALVLVGVTSVWASTPQRVRISDTTDRQFAVSWVTSAAETGRVHYGTSAGSLTMTAEDVRTDPTAQTHLVVVAGLEPGTDYFFEIESGGSTYDGGGSSYSTRTAARAPDVPEPPQTYVGLTRSCDGSTALTDVLVVATARVGGVDAVARVVVVDRVNHAGTGGSVLFDVSNARRADDVDSFLSVDSGAEIAIVLDGPDGDTKEYVYPASSRDLDTLDYCALALCTDADGDGYGSPGYVGCPNGAEDDCDDGHDDINPGATEVCDLVDNNCNAMVDEEPAASASCADDLFCNGLDSCDAGACVHSGDPCAENETCVEETDSCDVGTGINLVSFTATVSDESVVLAWETATEPDNALFHIVRSDSEDGTYARVTPSAIPARGDEFTGDTYVYTDVPDGPGTYYYKLEAVDIYGVSSYFGPVDATIDDDPGIGCGAASGGGAWLAALVAAPLGLALRLRRSARRSAST